jgi:hypothetical protein
MIQPQRELPASKSKLMKINESKIAFIYFHLFFGIGTFQRVTAEKNKNSSPDLANPFRLQAGVSDHVTISVGRAAEPPGDRLCHIRRS